MSSTESLLHSSARPFARNAIQAKAKPSLRTGAGGVGGLVAVSVGGDYYFPGYDNNGNVIGYWDESGSLVAEYAYDAFGNTISATGSMADVFPHRFSTKYYDAYGYRYYSPSLGRWISRDPIGEDGGSTNGFLRPLSKPLDLPTICMPTDWGAVYTVGRFHTHTPRTYITPTNIFRRVGPSDRDRERHAVYGVPGIVYDYIGDPDPLNNPTNRLYNGHDKEAPDRTYPIDPERRQTPQ